MPVRLAEVARHAGVSEATASRVLSGRGYVSVQSRERVRAAVVELDYIPNRAATALSRSRTGTVALLVHHGQYPAGGEGTFASRVVQGATRELRDAGLDMLYVDVGDDAVGRLDRLPAVRRSRSDGVIVLGPAFPPDALRQLIGAGRPVVLIDNRLDDAPVAAVMAENRPAVEALTEHLIVEHGHRRIACIAGPPDWPSSAERRAGYAAALASHGLPTRVVHATETTAHDGTAAVRLLGNDLPDAIVAVNDAVAIGVLHGLRKVAEQPAVVGFDDIAWARLTDPPLTTVSVDAELMGRRGAGLLLEQLESDGSYPPTTERIPAAPRFRGSCGCAPPQSDDL